MNFKGITGYIFKGAAVLLALAVLLPSAIKLAHAFNHHKHEVCDQDLKGYTHYHQSDLDCDFYKFKLNNTEFIKLYSYSLVDQETVLKLDLQYLKTSHNYQQLTRFLRGPPELMSYSNH